MKPSRFVLIQAYQSSISTFDSLPRKLSLVEFLSEWVRMSGCGVWLEILEVWDSWKVVVDGLEFGVLKRPEFVAPGPSRGSAHIMVSSAVREEAKDSQGCCWVLGLLDEPFFSGSIQGVVGVCSAWKNRSTKGFDLEVWNCESEEVCCGFDVGIGFELVKKLGVSGSSLLSLTVYR
ncbi:hypothetical protein Drorol1_Dr00019691 [Drosera rotundifolia]